MGWGGGEYSIIIITCIVNCRNFSLLSFGEEAEEDEAEVAVASKVCGQP